MIQHEIQADDEQQHGEKGIMHGYSRSNSITERDFWKEEEVGGSNNGERDGRGRDTRPEPGQLFVEGRV